MRAKHSNEVKESQVKLLEVMDDMPRTIAELCEMANIENTVRAKFALMVASAHGANIVWGSILTCEGKEIATCRKGD